MLTEICWLTASSVKISPVKAVLDWWCVYRLISLNFVMLIQRIFLHFIFLQTNKTHKLKYNKIDRKTQFLSGANSYMFRHQGAIIFTNVCCWKSSLWWHLGAEICRKRHLTWSVFCDLFYCVLVSAFCLVLIISVSIFTTFTSWFGWSLVSDICT